MKSQPVTIFELDLTEAAHFHEILCTTPAKLSEAAIALHDAVRDGLHAARRFEGTGKIIDVEITLDLGVLEEITPLFATRNAQQDSEAGLDSTLGYEIADVLLDALTTMRRLNVPVTHAELENFVYTPTSQKRSILSRIFGGGKKGLAS